MQNVSTLLILSTLNLFELEYNGSFIIEQKTKN
jgi:hypothetical protein